MIIGRWQRKRRRVFPGGKNYEKGKTREVKEKKKKQEGVAVENEENVLRSQGGEKRERNKEKETKRGRKKREEE